MDMPPLCYHHHTNNHRDKYYQQYDNAHPLYNVSTQHYPPLLYYYDGHGYHWKMDECYHHHTNIHKVKYYQQYDNVHSSYHGPTQHYLSSLHYHHDHDYHEKWMNITMLGILLFICQSMNFCSYGRYSILLFTWYYNKISIMSNNS